MNEQPDTKFLTAPLSVDDEFSRKAAKMEKQIKDDKERAAKELRANDIFGKAFQQWRPCGREIMLRYQRQAVSVGSKSALTASNMKQRDLENIGWEFQLQGFDPAQELRHDRANRDRDLGLDYDIRISLFDLGKKMWLTSRQLSLPKDLQGDKAPNWTPSNLKGLSISRQLQRLSNAVFVNSFARMLQSSPTPSALSKANPAWSPLQIAWMDTAANVAGEEALGVLFNIRDPGKATSELVVERTIGSFLQVIFDTLKPALEITSGQQMDMYGALSPYGCHPQPDLLARAANSVHWLLNPVCLIGEAKTEAKKGDNTLAQLATAAHGTLVLFLIAWCLLNPRGASNDHKEVKLPNWAIIISVTYTEETMDVHAFHPRAESAPSRKWKFVSYLLCKFKGVMAAHPGEKLRLLSAMAQIQKQALDFRTGMKRLLTDVFDYGNEELVIKAEVINKHPWEDRNKLQRISTSLADSIRKWEALSPEDSD